MSDDRLSVIEDKVYEAARKEAEDLIRKVRMACITAINETVPSDMRFELRRIAWWQLLGDIERHIEEVRRQPYESEYPGYPSRYREHVAAYEIVERKITNKIAEGMLQRLVDSVSGGDK